MGWGYELTKDTGQIPVHHLIDYKMKVPCYSFFLPKHDIQQLWVKFKIGKRNMLCIRTCSVIEKMSWSNNNFSIGMLKNICVSVTLFSYYNQINHFNKRIHVLTLTNVE